MLNKIICAMVLSFGLAACANQTAPQTAIAPKYDAAVLVGKWQCSARLDENTTVSSISSWYADGTGEGQNIFKMNLGKKLAWRFGVETSTKWRIDGDQYFEKYAVQPKANILPAESQSEELALKAFEKEYNLAKFKEEIRQAFEAFDDEETVAKIIQLNEQSFVSELHEDGKTTRINCQRI